MRILLATLLSLVLVVNASAQTPEALNAQTSIAGTGLEHLVPAEDGQVEVTKVGHDERGSYFQFIVHNGSDTPVHRVVVKVEVRDASGKLMATKNNAAYTLRPLTLFPNEYGIGHAVISQDFPAGFEVSARVVEYEEGVASNDVAIRFHNLNMFGDTVAGELVSDSPADLDAVQVVAICFDESGEMVHGNSISVDEPIRQGEIVTFSIDMYRWGDAPCAEFLIVG